MAASMTLDVDEKIKQQLDSIAQTTERSTAVVLNEALTADVNSHSSQVAQIERAMREAREIGTVPDEEVEAWMSSWEKKVSFPCPPESTDWIDRLLGRGSAWPSRSDSRFHSRRQRPSRCCNSCLTTALRFSSGII